MDTLADFAFTIEGDRCRLTNTIVPDNGTSIHANPRPFGLSKDSDSQIHRDKRPFAEFEFSTDPVSGIDHQHKCFQPVYFLILN